MHAAGEIDRAQLIAGTKLLAEREQAVIDQLAMAGRRTPLAPLLNRKGKTMAQVWYGPGGPDAERDADTGNRPGGLPLAARRAIIQRVVTITVNKTRRGKHLQAEGDYLDRSSIDFDWSADRLTPTPR